MKMATSKPLGALFIPVVPVPAARPKVGRWGTYYPKTYKEWRENCEKWLAENPIPEDATLPADPLHASLWFYVPRPKVTVRRFPRGDWDNYAKAVCDSLNGYVWRDDDQITDADAHKRFTRNHGDPYGVHVSWWPVVPEDNYGPLI